MNIYIDLILIASVVAYIVDLSGFTDSWRSALTRALGVHALRPLKPFDCGQCMVFWTTLAWTISRGALCPALLAYCAALAFFEIVLANLLDTIREGLIYAINKIRNIL